jgi:hypothetical protein
MRNTHNLSYIFLKLKNATYNNRIQTQLTVKCSLGEGRVERGEAALSLSPHARRWPMTSVHLQVANLSFGHPILVFICIVEQECMKQAPITFFCFMWVQLLGKLCGGF